MDTPHAFIETRYGRVRALCAAPSELLFSTGYGEEREDDPQRITVNRKDYLFDWGLQKTKPKGRPHAEPYDGGWYENPDRPGLKTSAWATYGGNVTEAARKVFKDQLAPVLVEWANGDEAATLLTLGKLKFHRDQRDRAVQMRGELVAALAKIDAVHAKIGVEELTADEVSFIHGAGTLRSLVEGRR